MKTGVLGLTLICFLILTTVSFATDQQVIQLPKPQMSGGKPLLQALKDRQTSRDFSTRKLTLQMISNLLWAADGINRPDSGKRTAPSAVNKQPIDVYIALPEGAYLYDAKANVLTPVINRDIRALTGKQEFVSTAPLNLIYVADVSKAGGQTEADRQFYAAADTGFIAENVYLFCSSSGLSTVVRANVDREVLAQTLNLRPDQKVTLCQSVGYPK